MPSNLLEVFTNCYGRYGVRAAIDLAPQAGITHLELAMKQHGGVLEIPEDVSPVRSWETKGSRI